MLKLLLQLLGWTLAHTPEPLLRVVSVLLGAAVYWLSPGSRRLALANLDHAFPGRPRVWQRAIVRENFRRLAETALLSCAIPSLGERRLRRIAVASPSLVQAFARHNENPQATLFCSPHLAYWEAQTVMPLILPGTFPEFGIIFRPLENPAANSFIKKARERFGMKLLSRRDGFAEALKILRRRGFIGVLFDQNAGMQGALSTLFGRIGSTTELPGLMAEKFGARVFGLYPRRLGFWRIEIGVESVESDGTVEGVTLALNRWLETILQCDDNFCASWLWGHERWRNQDIPQKRFRLEAKRNFVAADLRARGLVVLPRKTRVWVRLPNWLGDVVMAVPLLRALRASRPDAEITLVAKPQFLPLLESWAVADKLHALPPRGLGYFAHFWRLRPAYPDVWLLFTNSLRGDLEARLTGCRQRFGLVRPGKSRPLLSHAYIVPPDFDERTHHQLELWDNFLRAFGLAVAPDRTPLSAFSPPITAARPIGLICGSENNPEKRWPVTQWRSLIESFPHEHFVLFGTASDAPIASAVAAGFAAARVENLAGKTSLPDYCALLRTCRLLVTNDTGGMHLANALGVPLIALFGPTNPIRTGPVFNSLATILQPPGCPPTGGGALDALTAEAVAVGVREQLRAPRS